MASAPGYYMAEETRLENCLPVQNACLYLHGPLVSHFIDTPQCPFTSPHLSLKLTSAQHFQAT